MHKNQIRIIIPIPINSSPSSFPDVCPCLFSMPKGRPHSTNTPQSHSSHASGHPPIDLVLLNSTSIPCRKVNPYCLLLCSCFRFPNMRRGFKILRESTPLYKLTKSLPSLCNHIFDELFARFPPHSTPTSHTT